MNNHYLRLITYNSWANNLVIETITSQPVSDEIRTKMSHILWAEWAWFHRIQGKIIDRTTIKDHLTNEELLKSAEENSQHWNWVIKTQTDFNQIYEYKLLNGTESKSNFSDIVTHVVNHGTYHRGQIATLLRQAGLTPVATDFILFCRNNAYNE